ATGLELGHYLLHFVSLARVHEDACALLPQCLGHLQTQPLGAAGDQGNLAGQVEQLHYAHGVSSGVLVWLLVRSYKPSAARRTISERGDMPTCTGVIMWPFPRWILPWQNMTSGARR